ncbi:conserved hypothetical protein [Gloeothece citriformis PCC 7424]|uniref:NADAR domain-containing protein n=1 Tax=Gloeothece citriformis (strain PCC 7424) TaxID=65393 RepID=B7KCR0_GLOC7|nr:NADAR family protein [Gloeothece citriformis]ACK71611.1 conserved hypothetical protein [Gloeothece citriformis PCC 7424]
MVSASQYRTYNRQECITFRKTSEPFGGLSNMAGGYPLLVNGISILTSEALYQACRFPHLPDVQKLIIAQRSPMTAKMKSKPYRNQSRPDWDKVRVNIMRWCLRVKLIQNWERFGKLLLSTQDKPIVEDSPKDNFWGAIPNDSNQLIGVNVLGRLLMELRELLKQSPDFLKSVEPPAISDLLLLDKPIERLSLKEVSIHKHEINKSQTQEQIGLELVEETKLAQVDDQNEEQVKEDQRQNNVIQPYQEQKSINFNHLPEVYDAFYIILPYLEQQLHTEHTIQDLAEIFKVRPVQIKDWLEQGVKLGKIKKLSKPVRYISTSISKNEEMPLLDLLKSE